MTFNDKTSLNTFFKKYKLNYNVIPNGKQIIDKFKIPYYPYHIIIDKNGKIEYINKGISINVIEKTERRINKLLWKIR